MSYATLMVHSVVIIPKTRDEKSSEPVNASKKGKVRVEDKKDFASILKQAMK